jgi:NADPH2:quinone reductase
MADTIQALAFDHAAADSSATHVIAVPRPHPGDAEVAIAVSHAGVNFKDVMSRRGDPGYVTTWPHVPGIEAAGTVAEIGKDVSHLKIGQPVVALTNAGGLAEVALAPAALTVAVPDTLDLAVAAAAPGALSTAQLLLDLARLDAGESLLVHSAAGAVGGAIAQIARHAGAGQLVGTVGHADRREAARENGYDVVLTRDETLLEALKTTNDRGFDVILAPQGTAMLDADVSVAAAAGRIIVFGNASGSAPAPLPGIGALFAKTLSIGAFSLAGLSAEAPGRVRAAIERVLELLDAGVLSLPITYLDGLEAAADAQQALAEGRGTGKYIVTVPHRD